MVKRICFYYCLFYIVVVHYTRFIIPTKTWQTAHSQGSVAHRLATGSMHQCPLNTNTLHSSLPNVMYQEHLNNLVELLHIYNMTTQSLDSTSVI